MILAELSSHELGDLLQSLAIICVGIGVILNSLSIRGRSLATPDRQGSDSSHVGSWWRPVTDGTTPAEGHACSCCGATDDLIEKRWPGTRPFWLCADDENCYRRFVTSRWSQYGRPPRNSYAIGGPSPIPAEPAEERDALLSVEFAGLVERGELVEVRRFVNRLLAKAIAERDELRERFGGITADGVEMLHRDLDEVGIPREGYAAQGGGICEWTLWGRVMAAIERLDADANVKRMAGVEAQRDALYEAKEEAERQRDKLAEALELIASHPDAAGGYEGIARIARAALSEHSE